MYNNIDCADGDVRLVDGDNAYEGRVEICVSQVWSTVCHTGWGSEDARVVCRQLGFTPIGEHNHGHQ